MASSTKDAKNTKKNKSPSSSESSSHSDRDATGTKERSGWYLMFGNCFVGNSRGVIKRKPKVSTVELNKQIKLLEEKAGFLQTRATSYEDEAHHALTSIKRSKRLLDKKSKLDLNIIKLEKKIDGLKGQLEEALGDEAQ